MLAFLDLINNWYFAVNYFYCLILNTFTTDHFKCYLGLLGRITFPSKISNYKLFTYMDIFIYSYK